MIIFLLTQSSQPLAIKMSEIRHKYNINSVEEMLCTKCWRFYRANTNFRQVYAGDKSKMLSESWQICSPSIEYV